MRVLGLDLGSRTLGIAMSDVMGMVANGVETFSFELNHYKHAVAYVEEFVRIHGISKIVLGLPKNMDNSLGERAEISKSFARKVEVATEISVVLWDERLSTMEVERVLIDANVRRENRKKYVDKMAATVILQSYLDLNRNS